MQNVFLEEFRQLEKMKIAVRHDTVKGTKTPSHWHSDVEFLHCIDGAGYVWINAKRIPLEKGDLISINTNHIHSIQSDSSVTYYCLKIDKTFFDLFELNINSIIFSERIHDTMASSLVTECVNCYFSKIRDAFHIARLRGIFLSFLLHMCQNHRHLHEDVTVYSSKKYTSIMDTVVYISKNYSHPLTLDHLAKRVNYSKYHFSRFFKEITGNSITDQINHIRCNVAQTLLTETDKPVSEICYDIGFDNKSYFSKTFKKFCGCSPAEYRKKAK